MAGATPREAIQAFVEPLERAVSCLAGGLEPKVNGDFELGTQHVVTFGSGRGFPVAHPSGRFAVAVSLRFVIKEADLPAGPFRTGVVGYTYEVRTNPKDEAKGERVLAFHYHPRPGSYQQPHLHVSSKLTTSVSHLGVALGRHIPTGRVTLEEVVQYLVDEMGVRANRPDWLEVLTLGLGNHRAWRTWH